MKKTIKSAVLRAAKDYGLGWRIPHAYKQTASAPVDPRKVLFLEASTERMPEAFSVLFERMQADSRFDPRYVTLAKHRVSAPTYLANAEEFAREAATARLIFLCDTSDVVSCLPLRPETCVVQLWHACGAFKRWGMSTAEYNYGLNRKDILRHPFHANTALVTVSSAQVAWAYIEAMDLGDRPEIVKPLGVSRTDRFFDTVFAEHAREHLHAVLEGASASARTPIVLYAPTFRGPIGHARSPELPNFAAWLDALGPDAIILVKQHPMVAHRPDIPADLGGRVVDVTESMPIDELLICADALVTDYSSVIFEFSLFTRPMVFYAPDLDDYLDERNFFYSYEDMTPGPVARDEAELLDCLAHLEERFDAERMRTFREQFMDACDGHATERILDWALSYATR